MSTKKYRLLFDPKKQKNVSNSMDTDSRVVSYRLLDNETYMVTLQRFFTEWMRAMEHVVGVMAIYEDLGLCRRCGVAEAEGLWKGLRPVFNGIGCVERTMPYRAKICGQCAGQLEHDTGKAGEWVS